MNGRLLSWRPVPLAMGQQEPLAKKVIDTVLMSALFAALSGYAIYALYVAFGPDKD